MIVHDHFLRKYEIFDNALTMYESFLGKIDQLVQEPFKSISQQVGNAYIMVEGIEIFGFSRLADGKCGDRKY